MKFVVRFVFALTAVNALCLATALAIYVGRYEEMVSDLQKSRIMVAASATRSTIEATLDLGLKLRDAHDVNDLVVQITSRYPQVTEVSVLDSTGGVLFASSPNTLGTLSSDLRRLDKLSCGGDTPVSWSNQKFGSVALALCNSFRVQSGTLIVTYSREGTRARVEQTATTLIGWAIALLVGAATIMTLATYVIFRPITQAARQTAHRLNAVTDSWANSHFHDTPRESWFGLELSVFEANAVNALHTLGEAERSHQEVPQ